MCQIKGSFVTVREEPIVSGESCGPTALSWCCGWWKRKISTVHIWVYVCVKERVSVFLIMCVCTHKCLCIFDLVYCAHLCECMNVHLLVCAIRSGTETRHPLKSFWRRTLVTNTGRSGNKAGGVNPTRTLFERRRTSRKERWIVLLRGFWRPWNLEKQVWETIVWIPFTRLPTPPVCLSTCLSVHLSVCLSVCLSTCLSVCPPVCLSSLSTYPHAFQGKL